MRCSYCHTTRRLQRSGRTPDLLGRRNPPSRASRGRFVVHLLHRGELDRQRDGLVRRAGRADHLELRIALQTIGEHPTQQGVVIGKQDLDHVRHPPVSRAALSRVSCTSLVN